MKKLFNFLKQHKIITICVILAIAGVAFFVFRSMSTSEMDTRYVSSTIEKGVLLSTISGSGQVSALNQVSIKPKASGDVTYVNVKSGDVVKAGTIIAGLDSRDAYNQVKVAETNLQTAQLEMEELQSPTDEYTLLQAEHAVQDAQASLDKLIRDQAKDQQSYLDDIDEAEDNLLDAYDDTYNEICDIFLDLPDIMGYINMTLYGDDISDSQTQLNHSRNDDALVNSFLPKHDSEKYVFKSYINSCESSCDLAKDDYDDILTIYKNIDRDADSKDIEDLLEQLILTLKKISTALKNELNLLDIWVEYRNEHDLAVYSLVTQYQSQLSSYLSNINSHLSSAISQQSSIESEKDNIITAQENITESEISAPLDLASSECSLEEKEQKLADLKFGATEIEIRNKELSLWQKGNSLLEAQQNLADYTIRAPFDGQIVTLNIAKGDSVGSSTEVAVIITEQMIAEITLNEIDAAQVQVGQSATLTFDALPDLAITGSVVEIDSLGTVSSGVVSYGVKIAFDVQDKKIKSGMSVSVDIITESKVNVLLAPISAVKSSGANSYVEVLVDGNVEKKSVTVGSSSDTMVEIVSGLEEGESIITQIISAQSISSATTSTQKTSSNNDRTGGGMMFLR